LVDTQGSTPPRLVGIAGPLTGDVLPLRDTETTIGRDTSNAICLADLSLSRLHCAIIRTADGWRIRDLNSSNGTFVNGAPVTDHELSEGDRIGLGQSEFLFVTRPLPAGEPPPPPVLPDTLIMLPLAETAYLQPHGPALGVADQRTERGLRALLTISRAINAVRSEADLYRQLVDSLRDTVHAEHVAVVLIGSDQSLTTAHEDTLPELAGIAPSETVMRRALEARIALLHRRADLPDAPSLVAAGVSSLLCVPLAVRDRVLGVLYLATTSAPEAFDEDHLQLVTAIANVAAIAIDNVRHIASLESETERLSHDLGLRRDLVGRSPRMQRVYDLIAKVAGSEATTVLISGETGTGKELVAQAVHKNSPRAKRPFVAINCAALTEPLLESELFGHERGAFTGAVAQKKGKLEIADGGTVFLDEIGELAPGLQSRLLRVLQRREFERVGGTRSIPIDVRIISATNRDLAEEVEARRFRQDLYHRLNVIEINVPPLRERREDIPLLADHFVARFASRSSRPMLRVSLAAMNCLQAYDWPGNVRELENSIERAVVLGSGPEILPEDLPDALLDSAPKRVSGLPAFHDAVRDAKGRAIMEAFRRARGSYTETARLLGLHPNYLHRLIRNLGIKPLLEEDEACRSNPE
jgi:transcriptional regulator with GAF, ATPase, and Fis domain